MGPNDAELVRVWTREVGGAIGDLTFPYNKPFEVVVDVEAGNAIFGGGTTYQTGVAVRDLSDGTIIAVTSPASVAGNMGDPNWPAPAQQFVFTVPAANLGAGKENHCCEALAFLRARNADVDVSFATSSMFIITR